MEPSPKPKAITSRFGKLLADLAGKAVDFAVVGGLAVVFNGYPRLTLDVDIPEDSWREKDKLDVQAMREIIASESR